MSKTTSLLANHHSNPEQHEISPAIDHDSTSPWRSSVQWLKKLRGSGLVILGYLLSPLCWWNDLVFNLPIAYGVGAISNWLIPHSFFPGAIVGYWLSNVAGILLMQFGAVDLLKKEGNQHSIKQNLVTGLLSSTAYTVVIVSLVQLGVLSLPEGI